MTTFIEDAMALLVTASVGVEGSTTGWRIQGFYEPDGADVPDTIVTVYPTPGQAPNPKWALDYPAMQIRCRGSVGDELGTYTKAVEVKDALLGIASQDVGTNRWVSVTMVGDVLPLGKDEQGRPVYVLNFNLILEPGNLGNRDAL